jgi:hypothetical protein
MLDARIYRTGFAVVALAVIVFAFSLENQPAPLGTNLAPDAFTAAPVQTDMQRFARAYPRRAPGSEADYALASQAQQVMRQSGFTVSTRTFTASTGTGRRTIETVTGERVGLASGTIVIVSHRDARSSPDQADLSGTAVMLELARVLGGETLSHSVMLVSTSGSVGAAGTTELARQLAGSGVDAVIDLGDLAAKHPSRPVVVPWSTGHVVAPPVLRSTVAAALSGQAGLRAGGTGLVAQLVRLAFPITVSDQGPFGASGIPAVLISASGERGARSGEPISTDQAAQVGKAVLVSIDALDGGSRIPAPTAYLLLGGKVVPLWAVRMLVLALILPVLLATVDGIARARRRGHRMLGWAAWVLSSALPFLIAAALIRLAGAVKLLSTAPPGPVGAGQVPLRGAGIALLAMTFLVLVGGFALLRPLLARRLLPHGVPVEGEGPGAALLLIACVVTVALWLVNPFAALLVAPALHLWMWIVDPDVPLPRSACVVMIAIALVPPLLVVGYYVHAMQFSPVDVIWNGALLIAGGHLGLIAAALWSVVLGCLVSVAAIARRGPGDRIAPAQTVTVRGPITYAGPGSLGGTESALRR